MDTAIGPEQRPSREHEQALGNSLLIGVILNTVSMVLLWVILGMTSIPLLMFIPVLGLLLGIGAGLFRRGDALKKDDHIFIRTGFSRSSASW